MFSLLALLWYIEGRRPRPRSADRLATNYGALSSNETDLQH
jgi:hypothetical protein